MCCARGWMLNEPVFCGKRQNFRLAGLPMPLETSALCKWTSKCMEFRGARGQLAGTGALELVKHRKGSVGTCPVSHIFHHAVVAYTGLQYLPKCCNCNLPVWEKGLPISTCMWRVHLPPICECAGSWSVVQDTHTADFAPLEAAGRRPEPAAPFLRRDVTTEWNAPSHTSMDFNFDFDCSCALVNWQCKG